MCYRAAWTEFGCLISCSHEHKTVTEAASCNACAGCYVIGVEKGAIRSLTAEEQSEFECAFPSHFSDGAVVETAPVTPEGAAVSDSDYAVMTRIRLGDRWTWTTWMRFETYAEAAAHAREGDKVVRFRSPEWEAVRQQTEAALPRVRDMSHKSLPPRGERETLVEFVLRFLEFQTQKQP